MRATTLKGIRDLRRQRGQVIAVAITIMLGVLLYVATAGAFLNLKASYQGTYDRLHFADLTATGGNASQVADAALGAGAERATTRVQNDPPLKIDGTTLVGRIVGMPVGERPAVGDIDVIDGAYLDSASGQALVEKHAAEAFNISVGDTVSVFAGGQWNDVTVAGVAVSAEYIWPARNRQDVLSDSKSFAVLFVPEALAEQWAGTGPNQALVTLPSDAPSGTEAAVTAKMRGAGAADVTPWQDQASQATLQEDLDGFNEMSVAFPMLFLTAAAVASYVLLARRILQERPIIGTLMASGARRGRVLRHYLGQGLAVGLLGSVVGVALGLLANSAVTKAYTGALGIPDTVVNFHPALVLNGLLFGVVVGVLGALAPAITASRTAPAEAMRSVAPPPKPGPWARFVARLDRLPATVRMALRDVGRSRRRTLATMLGSVLAMVLVLATIGLVTSMLDALHVQFHEINKEDASVSVDSTVAGQAPQVLAGVPGVAIVEPTSLGSIVASSGDLTYATSLRGFEPGTTLHGFRSTDGSYIDLPKDGVLAGQALADALDVSVGDTITLATDTDSRSVTLVGLLNEPLGTTVYSSEEFASTLLPDTGVTTFVVGFDDGVDRDAMRNTITGESGVVAYVDAKALAQTVDQYLGLFWAFAGVMIALGAVLALAVIYVTMAVNIVERTNELATLRAAGVPLRKVAGTIATESLVATALGLPFGLGLGVLAAKAFLASFSSDLFSIDLVWQWWVLPATALGVLAAAAISQWPAARAIKHVDIAKVVRERSA